MAPIRLSPPAEDTTSFTHASRFTGNTKTTVGQVHKDAFDPKENELHAGRKANKVNFEAFYGFQPSRVDSNFNVTLSDRSYLPKIDSPRADWVVTAATNAFTAFQYGGLGQVQRFATVGTGSGTDVIAALDIFTDIKAVAMTDLHDDVVAAAKANVLASTANSDAEIQAIAASAVARAGDMLLPLAGEAPYDLIYEYAFILPTTQMILLGNGQASSTYVGDRTSDKIPSFASAALLDLHFVALAQARNLGLIETMLKLAEAAGYAGRVISLSWKEQSEPENVIGGYAEFEKNGLGPFFFYPLAALEMVFAHYKPASAALCWQQIEIKLARHRLNATEALQRYREGEKIGHTVVVMGSVLKAA